MITKRIVSVVLLLMLIVVAGCATMNAAKLSPQQEFLLNAEKAYLVQYNDYVALTKMPSLTAEQKEMARTKKAVLVQVEPLIKLYRATVYAGGVPSIETEQAIYNLLTSIGGKL